MKIYDVVRINSLTKGEESFGCEVTDEMESLSCKLAVIIAIDTDKLAVRLNIDSGKNNWSIEMINIISEKEVKKMISEGIICKKCKSPFGVNRGTDSMCISCHNSLLKNALRSIIKDLGCLEETGDPQIDSYTDSAIKTARQALKECE